MPSIPRGDERKKAKGKGKRMLGVASTSKEDCEARTHCPTPCPGLFPVSASSSARSTCRLRLRKLTATLPEVAYGQWRAWGVDHHSYLEMLRCPLIVASNRIAERAFVST